MKLFVSICVFTLVAQAAFASPAPDKIPSAPAQAGPRIIVNPDWALKPAGEDLANAYPPAAAIAHVNGKTAAVCRVAEDGTLYDCRIIKESPTDWGFGAAMLSVTPRFRMRPRTVNGAPVAGATVEIPLTWKMADDPPATPPATEAAAPETAALPPPSPSKLALALEMQQRIGGSFEGIRLANLLYQEEIKPLAAGDPERAKILESTWRASVDKLTAETNARYALSIANTYSDRELEQIVAFLRTDAGAAMVGRLTKARAVAFRSARLSLIDFLTSWRSFYCSEVICSPWEITHFEDVLVDLRSAQPPTPQAQP